MLTPSSFAHNNVMYSGCRLMGSQIMGSIG
jgi:hypothetical protein